MNGPKINLNKRTFSKLKAQHMPFIVGMNASLAQASNLDILKRTQGGKNSKLKEKLNNQGKNFMFWQILIT